MQIVVRPLDNPYVDALVTRYRGLHGNTMIGKQEFARGLIAAMRENATVGILMDTNMTPPQGVFVDFFGIPACTASGLARVALHTGAAVVPAFTIWDPVLRKYRVEFDPALDLVRTGDRRSRHRGQHCALHQGHRAIRAPLSRSVAVGASPLENASDRRAGVVLARRFCPLPRKVNLKLASLFLSHKGSFVQPVRWPPSLVFGRKYLL